jgi:hypothetical protein
LEFIKSMLPLASVAMGAILGWLGVLLGERRRNAVENRNNLRNAYASWFTAYRIAFLRLKALGLLIERSVEDREEYLAATSELKGVLPILEELLRSHHNVLLLEKSVHLRGMVQYVVGMVSTLYGHVSGQLLEFRDSVRLFERVDQLKKKLRELEPSHDFYAERKRELDDLEAQVRERHSHLVSVLKKGNEDINKRIAEIELLSFSIVSFLGERVGFGSKAIELFNPVARADR